MSIWDKFAAAVQENIEIVQKSKQLFDGKNGYSATKITTLTQKDIEDTINGKGFVTETNLTSKGFVTDTDLTSKGFVTTTRLEEVGETLFNITSSMNTALNSIVLDKIGRCNFDDNEIESPSSRHSTTPECICISEILRSSDDNTCSIKVTECNPSLSISGTDYPNATIHDGMCCLNGLNAAGDACA